MTNLTSLFTHFYFTRVLRHPVLTLLLVTLFTGFFAYHAPDFRLDASADSLVLENDTALDYYRSIRARYGSDDFLIITYNPEQDLFDEATLSDLHQLREDLRGIERVESVISILDVPLIQSPPVSLRQLSHEIPTLESPRTDKTLARKEFLNSPMYRNLIISEDLKTTALQVNFSRDENWHRLLKQRDELRELRLNSSLTSTQQTQLEAVSYEFEQYSAQLQDQLKQDISTVRGIMDKYRDAAELHLGGVPMIASDSIDFIRHDLNTFGFAVVAFLMLILGITFRKPRWIILPMLTCLTTGLITVGFLGLVDWPVTVVSSNFISLLLIITLSLNVHLIVRYRELHERAPDATQFELLSETIRSKFVPCSYTAITTIVAFGSLLFSGIRPVIDFGWMMSIGIVIAFVLVFTLFPATLMFLTPGKVANANNWTDCITAFLARLIQVYGRGLLTIATILALLSVLGISLLSVENRFIDYFKDDTEIYRGMALIDRQLGGTTPLDVIIDAPAEFFAQEDDKTFEDEYELRAEQSAGITATSYWFNTFQLQQVFKVHDYLDGLSETGKVLSLTTAMRMLQQIDQQVAADDFLLAVFYKKLPPEMKNILFKPYLSKDGNQLRFAIRVFESDPSLQREALLEKIRTDLSSRFDIKPDQIHLSGMLVLYNNMLQSLFRSQILTIGVVFLAVLIMFAILFRNARMAVVALIPNIFAALLMLGLMGWLRIPLDMMTITIAAIIIGIAVDDTIHYIHRFSEEFRLDQDYWSAVKRSHASIGRAMYYTTITITLGFSILALSNFIPTIYFGLLTGFAMLIALLADLTLLPLLLVIFKPIREIKVRMRLQ